MIEAVLIWIAVVLAVMVLGALAVLYLVHCAPMDTEIWPGGEPE